ncbi:MAG TPA: TfoX/Sxy family protein [Luteitalea sp.]|nr:TfoX/Sxy family protein [Luteitalea sp.]
MVRDKGLEAVIEDDLASVSGLTSKSMFGGWVWLLHNNLLCGSREEGMLVRLGKGNDAWALEVVGIEPMYSGERRMHGWVRAAPSVYADARMRRRLIDAALQFVRTLPRK